MRIKCARSAHADSSVYIQGARASPPTHILMTCEIYLGVTPQPEKVEQGVQMTFIWAPNERLEGLWWCLWQKNHLSDAWLIAREYFSVSRNGSLFVAVEEIYKYRQSWSFLPPLWVRWTARLNMRMQSVKFIVGMQNVESWAGIYERKDMLLK